MVFCTYKPGFSDQDFIYNVEIVIDPCDFFANCVFFYLCLFPLTYVSPIFDMIDWLYHVSPKNELARNLIFFFGGMYSVPQKLLPMGCSTMGQHHLHMFTVDYRYVKYSLLLDEFFLWLRLPVDSLSKQVLS